MRKTAKPKTSTHKFIVGLLVATLAFCAVSTAVHAAGGAVTGWSKTYGGIGSETTGWAIQSSDGGYLIVGSTNSYGAGNLDLWLVKTDSSGNILWNKTYGGTGSENGRTAIQTADGGYLIAGSTDSFGAGSTDGWLVKIDASGNVQWNKTYGTSGSERLAFAMQAMDGGYAVIGYLVGTVEETWLIKTDANGNMQWNKTYATYPVVNTAFSGLQTSDGGYAFVGANVTGTPNVGNDTSFFFKTDSSGNMQWNKTYGLGPLFDLYRTSDGGYALVGRTNAFGAGGNDGWLIKTDANGNLQWNKTYGGRGNDQTQGIVQTIDGGYALGGRTNSFGAGGNDLWLIKVDLYGNQQWSKTFGGPLDETFPSGFGHTLVQTVDGGYVMAAATTSFGAGGQDFYLVKTDAVGNAPAPPAATAFCSVTVLRGWTWYFFVHSNGGVGAHTYQWYEGTAPIVGQTSMVLPVTKTTAGAYTFYCKVTDAQGITVNSNGVTLTVLG